MADTELVTLQCCVRAIDTAVRLALEKDQKGADRSLSQAEHCLKQMRSCLPTHARRRRLAEKAMERGHRAVLAARGGLGSVELERRVSASERASQAAMRP